MITKYRIKFNCVTRDNLVLFKIQIDEGNGWRDINTHLYYAQTAKELIEKIIEGEIEWIRVPCILTTKQV
jgi:hypothetical protein